MNDSDCLLSVGPFEGVGSCVSETSHTVVVVGNISKGCVSIFLPHFIYKNKVLT